MLTSKCGASYLKVEQSRQPFRPGGRSGEPSTPEQVLAPEIAAVSDQIQSPGAPPPKPIQLISLQRTLGNHATVRILARRPSPAPAPPHTPPARTRPADVLAADEPALAHARGDTAQLPDAARAPVEGAGGKVIQRRPINNVDELREGIILAVNAGETDGGSNRNLLTRHEKNVTALTPNYTPPNISNVGHQNSLLKQNHGKDYFEREGGWYDRVDARIKTGAQQTTEDFLFWSLQLRNALGIIDVSPISVELLGAELHDKGLGPAKVEFSMRVTDNLLTKFLKNYTRTYVIKPDDRGVEAAILGNQHSVAEQLNQHVTEGRKVKTLGYQVDQDHGTMMEFVGPSIKAAWEKVLRTVGYWSSTEVVTGETIALAFLTGLYDLHHQNVLISGGAPALIDADVAVRPLEYAQEGPSQQAGFAHETTQQVRRQLTGENAGYSQILQYAINHPAEVAAMVTGMIGNHKSRIVPVLTAELQLQMYTYVSEMADGNAERADQIIHNVITWIAHGHNAGGRKSPGLARELGQDSGLLWGGAQEHIGTALAADFGSGVVPHFQYQASTGEVFLHGAVIWRGQTIEQSMMALRGRLEAAAAAAREQSSASTESATGEVTRGLLGASI